MSYLLLALIAALGFIASAACHLMGWLHVEPPGREFVFVLHAGCIALWVPLITSANRTTPKAGRNSMVPLFAEFPPWLRRVSSLLFAYAFLNFFYFIYCTHQYPKHEVPFYVELRGFSGHWMLFYGMAVMGFVGLARITRKRKENETGL